ncbi:MAG: WecB/TagA/CpsF family glycosyltransferase [Candidatus Acidiferrales bacterium]
MIDQGKRNVLGVLVNVADYEGAVERIISAARARRGAAISALAVHGLMTGVLSSEHRHRLNQFDLLVPDGQPIRWALNWLHRAGLRQRVYGPNLMLAACARAEQEGISIYFYGSTPEILSNLKTSVEYRYPALKIAGMEPSRFRCLSPEESRQLANRIRQSGASIVLVGLGCPRQEVWAYEFRGLLRLPILAVGAAFPFTAGKVPQAPKWMQARGLEWVFRWYAEPRLWRRYLFLNPAYLVLLVLQFFRLFAPAVEGKPPVRRILYG